MDSNQFVVIFRTSKMFSKSGPLDPLFIAEIIKKYKKSQTHFNKLLFYISEHFGNPKFENVRSPEGTQNVFVGPQQLVLTIVLNKKKRKIGWWNLDKPSKSCNH